LGCGVWVVGCGASHQFSGPLLHRLSLSRVDLYGRDADAEVRRSKGYFKKSPCPQLVIDYDALSAKFKTTDEREKVLCAAQRS